MNSSGRAGSIQLTCSNNISRTRLRVVVGLREDNSARCSSYFSYSSTVADVCQTKVV